MLLSTNFVINIFAQRQRNAGSAGPPVGLTGKLKAGLKVVGTGKSISRGGTAVVSHQGCDMSLGNIPGGLRGNRILGEVRRSRVHVHM